MPNKKSKTPSTSSSSTGKVPPKMPLPSDLEKSKKVGKQSNSTLLGNLGDRVAHELTQALTPEQRNALNQAKHVITFAKRREEQLEHFRREDLFDELRSNAFFQKLQTDFFRSILPIPENITQVLSEFQNVFSYAQKLELGEIGQAFRNLPFDYLSDAMNAEQCYKTTVDTLKKQANFFQQNPNVLQHTATQFLKSYLPFGNFLGQALEEVLKSGLVEPQKQTLQRAINGSLNALEMVTNTIEQIPNLALNLGGEFLLQELPQQIFKATLPIPAAITQILISFHDSLSKEQKTELAEIGKNFATLPLDLLMGKIDPVECFDRITDGVTRLTTFFIDNPEILVKTAGNFLKSFVPFGNFLSNMLNAVVNSDVTEVIKQPLTNAIESAVSSFGSLTDVFKQAPKFARDLGFDL